MRAIYLHGWPDGPTDTATLANRLRTEGVELLEIDASASTPSTIEAIVEEYLRQVPSDDAENILIGYCAAGHYAIHLSRALARQGRPPLACLLIEAIYFSGRGLIEAALDRHAAMPASTQVRRQAERLFPPFDEAIGAVVLDWIRTKLAIGSRVRRLAPGSGGGWRRTPTWIPNSYERPTFHQIPPLISQPVVVYNAVRPHSDSSPYGPAGSLWKSFGGPVAVRSFDGVTHQSVLADPGAARVASAIARDVEALAAGGPLVLSQSFAAP